MATRIEPFTVTIPASTAQDAFQKTALSFNPGRVDQIDVRVPPGPSGLMGFRVAHSGQAVLPFTGERWFVMDDDKAEWHLESFPTGDAWELWAYNTDIYPHDVHIWFYVTELGRTIAPIITPVAIAQIAPAEIESELTEG